MSTASDDELPPNLMDAKQLAELLNVNIRHIRRLVHEKRVPVIKLGGLVRFDPAEIGPWIDGMREPPRRAG